MFVLLLLLLHSWSAHSFAAPNYDNLHIDVNGRLYPAFPLASPCYSTFSGFHKHECSIIQQNYSNPVFKSSKYANSMQPEWDTCITTNQGCLLDYADPSNLLPFINQTCYQGSLSQFYIDVQTPDDVRAAFAFSKSTGVPLSIKNSGHDYKGRSTMRNSLALWTRNLNDMSHTPSFVPDACPHSQSYNAITTGAGNIFQDIYQFADQHNVTFIGGYARTVGSSGGWLMGGGHSVLSPVYGLGVDRVLQFKIVTPTGLYLTANACQNTDLFWALRGGGGGTFGVVLESTHRVEPMFPLVVAFLSMKATPQNIRPWYEILVNSSSKWASEGWGGHIIQRSPSQPAVLIYVTPLLSLSAARSSMASIASYASSHGGNAVIEELPSWYAFFEKYVIPGEMPVGQLLAVASRLIPSSVFTLPTRSSHLVDLLLTLPLVYIPVVGPHLYNQTSPLETSVTPAWRDTLWHVNTGITWHYDTPTVGVEAHFARAHEYTLAMMSLAPESGAYLNEGDVYQTDHEMAFWGENYAALLLVKKKYDPSNLLDCWQCVGWKGPKDENFACYPHTPSLS